MQTTPHAKFLYSSQKDVENIIIGLNTVSHGRVADKSILALVEKYGANPSRDAIHEYVVNIWKNKQPIQYILISQVQEYWNSIEEKFFTHLADRMQLESFFDVNILHGYLSIRWGSGYNSHENWFAISTHNGTLKNSLTAMHEIMHIFFHKQWWELCKEQGLEEKNIWDVKEAMTALLNLWFKNQIIDVDTGYEEHSELRFLIEKWFLESRNFKRTLIKACKFMKEHKEKSPVWVK